MIGRLGKAARMWGLVLTVVLWAQACSTQETQPNEVQPKETQPQEPRASAVDEPGELLPVPEPDLSTAAESVREQVREQKAKLDALLADSSAEGAERAQAFGDLGLRYLVYDFLDAADVCFANARTLAPQDFRWIYLGGYLHKIQGRLQPAAEFLERTLALEKDFLPAILRLGRTRLELGERDVARQLFERALELDASSGAAMEGLGKLAAAEGDARGAVDYLEKALAREPEATSLHYALGQAWRNLGDLDKARFHLKRRGDVAVRVPDPMLNPLADLGAGAQFYVLRGQESIEKKDYQTAAAAFERALEEDPGSFSAYRGLSYAVEKLGNLEGAIEHLERGLEQATANDEAQDHKQRAELHRILGGLEALSGDDTAAIGHFERSLELEAEQPGVRLKLANALARARRFDDAVGHYDQLIASHPDLAGNLYARRATVQVNLGRRDAAVADFEKAIEADPENAQLRLRYAEALEFLGSADKAAEQWAAATRYSEEDADRARLLAEDATRLVSQGRFEEAVAQFRESLRLAPDQTSVRSELASVLGHLGRMDEAIAEFRKVIEAEPRHAAARRGEILALILTGRYGPSRVRLQEALKEFPQDAQLAHLQARLLASVPDPRVRDGNLALEIARRLAAVRQDLRVRETLAMALAEAGSFDQAVEVQKSVVGEAESLGDQGLMRDVRAKLESFERRQAWTAASGEEILAAAMGAAPSG